MKDKLQVSRLTKAFGERQVLRDVSFTLRDGEFLSVLGPSGCGKTTLLRILIGVEAPGGGQVLKDGRDITHAPASERGMGIVFQNYALFPNMTALQNVAYPLRFRPELKARAKETALALLERVGLSEHLDKRPHQLSGGQQQRVAIARTLALSPDVVLFDEPMSALDAATRVSLRGMLKKLQQELGVSMLYITHDQEEAFALSDRTMVMNEGVIQQIGAPRELFHHPANAFVEGFVTRQLQEKLSSLRESAGV